MKILLACGATLTALILFSMAPPAPAAGPGGVVDAVTRFLDAVDAADSAAIGDLLTDADHGVDLVRTLDGGLRTIEKAGFAAFVDVSAAGRAIAWGSAREFQAAASAAVRGGDDAPELVETHVRAVHADCPSGACSWGVVDFERVYRHADGSTVSVPMCATALLAHADGRFRLFHWHASRTVAR